jgi:hypothetical protein
MIYAQSAAAYGNVLLRMESGVARLGVALPELEKHLGTPERVTIQSAVSWNFVVGPAIDLRIAWPDLRKAMRRWFGWTDMLHQLAGALVALGSATNVSRDAESRLARLALADSWPASIDGWQELVQRAAAQRRSIAAVSELGLLLIVADALADPWGLAEEPLAPPESSTRLARLGMAASDGLASPEVVLSPPDAANPYSTTRVLVTAGRLCERDDALRWLVRAHEIYGELLTLSCPFVDRRFRASQGCSIRAWVTHVCGLVNLIEETVRRSPDTKPVLDFGPAETEGDERIKIAAALSRDRVAFAERYRELGYCPDKPKALMQPIRERPLLRVDERQYLVLHDDFLLGAADDGIWYRINDSLSHVERSNFHQEFGRVLECYAERVLRRCAASVSESVFAAVERRDGDKRCDFVWRVGDYLVLIEAKRAALTAEDLDGSPDLARRIDRDVGPACRQLLATHAAIHRDGLNAVAPSLSVPEGWQPRGFIPVIVTHRPVFLWFSSRRELVQRAGIDAQWQCSFAVAPVVWSLADLEVLEASAPTVSLQRLLQDILADHASTFANVPTYLASIGYTGVTASEYVDRRRHEILRGASERC